MALAAILTAGTALIQSADKLIGGSGTPDVAVGLTPCPNQPSDAAFSVAWNAASQAERQQLIGYYQAGNNGASPPAPYGTGSNPYAGATPTFAFVKALMGGSDCVNKGSPLAPQAVMQLVAKYGNASTAPIYSGAGLQQSYATAADDKSLGDYLRQVWNNVSGTAENIAKATIGGAVQGATVSTQAASTASGAGTQFQLLMPILLVAAGVAIVLLMRNR